MPVVEPYADTQSAMSHEPDSSDSDGHDTPDKGAILGTPTDEATLTISLTGASGAQVPGVPVSLDVDGAEGPPAARTTGGDAVTAPRRASAPGTLAADAT